MYFGHNVIGCLIEYINMDIFFLQIFMYVNLSKPEFSYILWKNWLKKSLVTLLFLKKVFLKISQSSQEIPLSESLFKKVKGSNTDVFLWILPNF